MKPSRRVLIFQGALIVAVALLILLPRAAATVLLLMIAAVPLAIFAGLLLRDVHSLRRLREPDFWHGIFAIFRRPNRAGTMPPSERVTSRSGRIFWLTVMLAAVLIGAYYTVYLQKDFFKGDFIMDWQFPMQQDVMHETAGNPWQYRLMSNYLLDFLIHRAWDAGYAYEDGIRFVFLNLRYTQNVVIFMAMIAYYRLLGVSYPGVIFGMLLFTWAVSHSLINSNYNYDTYFDLMFYLFGAIFILRGWYWLIIPLTALAVTNRETGGLIPLMLLFESFRVHPASQDTNRFFSLRNLKSRFEIEVLPALIAGIALALFIVIYLLIRASFPPQPFIGTLGGNPGWNLIKYNLTTRENWEVIFKTMGIIPVIVFLAWRRLPRPLQSFLWAVVPLWTVAVFWGGNTLETRLFLEPYALVMIPGVMLVAVDPRARP